MVFYTNRKIIAKDGDIYANAIIEAIKIGVLLLLFVGGGFNFFFEMLLTGKHVE